ncbi:MAG: TIGR01777 family protein [Candidatus Eisenbacteria bacterium]|uniref:TIGR01777 family protein n=1 Tax=Eiseniibacteriota bacterium TaxID=2212470 RepID=A0A538UEG3_UNCEI|nr:MAG: TIGR01777 family protein [Candidatus Eisenbacteria bacterium]
MRVLMTGARGLIGAALAPALTARGHAVVRLVRVPPRGPDEFRWDPAAGALDAAALAGCDAVIHLAGESLAAGRWTTARKARIRSSRVEATRLLAEAVARAPAPPRVMVSASAVGWYGDRGDEVLDEACGPGTGYLADLARDWEAAAQPAAAAGVRVVHLRFGMVLAAQGGALPRMVTPFALGLGGPFGSGGQWVSWIALKDLVSVVDRVLTRPGLNGPLNTVAPEPVRNREFASALARGLGRPAWLTVPRWALSALLGEMGEELLLASQRAVPSRLLADGYVFQHPRLEEALREIVGPGRRAG